MSTLSSLQWFRLVATEFSAETDDTVDNFIELAANRHSGDAWGSSTYPEAMAWCAAHHMAMRDKAAAGTAGSALVGAVTSRRAGDIAVGSGGLGSVTYSRADTPYTQTTYGLEYLALKYSRSAVTPYLSEVGTD